MGGKVVHTTSNRQDAIREIEEFANKSQENCEIVNQWLDGVLIEGIKEMQIRFFNYTEGVTKESFLKEAEGKLEMLIVNKNNRHYKSLSDLPEESFDCYSCGEEIAVDLENVETLYSVDDSDFFHQGQHDELPCPRSAAHEDSIDYIISAGGANGLLYHPKKEEYKELEQLYEVVFNVDGGWQ